MSDLSRVRNAAAELADQMRRLERARQRFAVAVAAVRAEGAPDGEIAEAVRVACSGRPDRARALEAFAAATRPTEERG